jgi:hypothetical protein
LILDWFADLEILEDHPASPEDTQRFEIEDMNKVVYLLRPKKPVAEP